MGMILQIDSPDFIDAVNDIIHDCWFAVEEISFDALASRLTIPFEYETCAATSRELLRQARSVERRPGILQFDNVLSYVLEDTERVGRYDFNRIQYRSDQRVVEVITNIPLRLAIQVGTFHVAVEVR